MPSELGDKPKGEGRNSYEDGSDEEAEDTEHTEDEEPSYAVEEEHPYNPDQGEAWA